MAELFLIAAIAGEPVAIPAEDVHSVCEIEAVAPVPRAPAHVAGLAAIRSRVLTVIDCGASIGGGDSACGEGPRPAVLVESDGHSYALLVDRVDDVIEGPARLDVRSPLNPAWGRVATGFVELGDALLLVVDVRKLIAGPTAPLASAA